MWNDLEEFILKTAIENSEKTGEITKIVEIICELIKVLKKRAFSYIIRIMTKTHRGDIL